MRLLFTAVVFVAALATSYAVEIDLHKPVQICSAQMLVDVVNNVCQTPLTAARRRRRSIRDSEEVIDGVTRMVRNTRPSMQKHSMKMSRTLVRDFANVCCYTPCLPSRFLDIC
ncbi:uncharacterized protein [Dermacentor andersoni]|uniref:uncharacterized protein n=1 Tax=Dermacentor andersoni TaxID=34620 RepID=UPI0021559621|nr:uncharacterized protein LOC126546121 [Dermacentor andersoni]